LKKRSGRKPVKNFAPQVTNGGNQEISSMSRGWGVLRVKTGKCSFSSTKKKERKKEPKTDTRVFPQCKNHGNQPATMEDIKVKLNKDQGARPGNCGRR